MGKNGFKSPRRWTRLGAGLLVLALVAAACGDDDDATATTDGTTTTTGGEEATTTAEEVAATTTTEGEEVTDTTEGGLTEPASITLSKFPTTVQTFYPYLAMEMGFFEDHLLDVDLIDIASGPDLATALISGSSQVSDEGLAIIGPLMTEQGEDIVVLMGNILMNYGLVVRPDIDTPNIDAPFPGNIEDLRGLVIGVTARGSLTEDFVRRLLTAAGMNPDTDVTFVATGGAATLVPAFQQGQVDATVTFPPIAQLLGEPDTDYKVVADVTDKDTVGDLFDGYLVDVYAAMGGWIEDNPEATIAFCRAMKDTVDFAQNDTNIEQVAEVLAEYLALDVDVATDLWEQYKGTFSHEMTEELWEAQGEFTLSGPGVPPYEDHVHQPCREIFAG